MSFWWKRWHSFELLQLKQWLGPITLAMLFVVYLWLPGFGDLSPLGQFLVIWLGAVLGLGLILNAQGKAAEKEYAEAKVGYLNGLSTVWAVLFGLFVAFCWQWYGGNATSVLFVITGILFGVAVTIGAAMTWEAKAQKKIAAAEEAARSKK